MGIVTTPIFGLQAMDDLEPLANIGAVTRANAATVEAALQARGVAAPGASDLLAVSGRVSTLEVDSGWQIWPGPTGQAPGAAGGWPTSGTAGPTGMGIQTTALGVRYRRLGKIVYVQGEFSATSAQPANKVLAQLATTARPARAWWWAGVGYGGAAMPMYVDSAGQIIIANALAAGAGGWVTTSYPVG